jgi:hypothetical protein
MKDFEEQFTAFEQPMPHCPMHSCQISCCHGLKFSKGDVCPPLVCCMQLCAGLSKGETALKDRILFDSCFR